MMSEDFSDSESDTEQDPIYELRETLRQRSIRSEFHKTSHDFVPEGVIDEVVTFDQVESCLDIRDPSTEDYELVRFVMTGAKRAFATAIFAKIDVKLTLEWLRAEGLDDNKLPVKQRSKNLRKGWKGDFCENQWRFFAAKFDSTKHSHIFDEALILPFLKTSVVTGEGSFGEVSRTEIHPNHMKPELINNGVFAVKELKQLGSTQEVVEHWEREVKALRMMNELEQDNIVRFITAFRRVKKHADEHYVVFEWADGGNLQNLWDRIPSPELSGSLIKLVVDQLHGLAAALTAAHNLGSSDTLGASYRHGDLKPENILVFEDGGPIGKLKIGDWGEAKYQGKITAIRAGRTTTRFGNKRYEAPEVETGVKISFLGQSKERRSRLGDVWAMGCITLEFIVWLLYGKRGLDQFNHDVSGDTFYTIFTENGEKVARVHVNAVAWMKRMALEPVCRVGITALGDLLELVTNNLLVVKLPQQLGSELPPDRSRVDSVADIDIDQDQTSSPLEVPTNDMDRLSIFEEDINVEGPSITVTPAAPIIQPEESRMPLQPRLEAEGSKRCYASIFRDRMDHIVTEDDIEGYWDVPQTQLEAPTDVATVDVTSMNRAAPLPDMASRGDYASPELDENHWKLLLDNDAASAMFFELQKANAFDTRAAKRASKLCASCSMLRSELRETAFWKKYDVRDLKSRANSGSCALCTLLWDTCKRNGGHNARTVQFDREGAFLKLDTAKNVVLSLVCNPERGLHPPSDCQIGLVELPEAGSLTHLSIIRHWLNDCDTNSNHSCNPAPLASSVSSIQKPRMPTRLLDVGHDGDNTVFLWETDSRPGVEWIALSHRWGEHNFSTTADTREKHINGLKLGDLPATFKDAVTVTRALGKRFLWIDSLCIIQGPDGDFAKEATRMADVYSGAYCVIAASCAAHHYDGFLKRRSARQHVTMVPEGENQSPYYICETIDNFKRDVLDGPLNLRGWVLQEHALARRTIFFAEHQTYFECKDGVKCETSTKLANDFAKFLGDADFPNHLLKAKRGEKINRIQKLFSDYSRLGFSQSYDRPVAIAGLQEKLIETINVRGDYGVIEDKEHPGWLRRSLLWHRGPLVPSLTRIVFSADRADFKVPSWSWMAFDGGIDYLRPDFGSYDWEPIESPWARNGDKRTDIALLAHAWKYDPQSAGPGELDITFDIDVPGAQRPGKRMCVVLGRAKGSLIQDTRRHWVLIIGPTPQEGIYERIGAGFLPGRCLSRTASKEKVRIH